MATLESVFAQTFKDFEIIIVDNASTDNTRALLNPLVATDKVRYIEHEHNFERAHSRNTGMDKARGDYLTFLDSDDFMSPNCLADAAAFARTNPNVKCFHNLYELVNSDRKVIHRYKFPSIKNRLKSISSGNFMSCIGNFVHSTIFRRYRFDTKPELTGSEDWEYWMRILADYEVGRIDKYNCAVQHHEARTINNQNIDAIEAGLIYLSHKFREDEHLSAIYDRYLDRIEASSFLYLNVLANDAKNRGRACEYLRRSAQADFSVLFTERFLRCLRRTVLT
ncbi:MAG: glycosyltransferase family 2 protein [Acidobacteria bacterium]|nr:glycosyltransferase family 2 protein [Acidobacteriota bacterium]